MMKKLTLTVAAVMLPFLCMAQSVKTDFDKKIVLVDSLNLPENTGAKELLYLLPELLQRSGDFLMSNYDIQIEGMSVGQARDVALTQLQIVDLEKIEVSESPVSSYQNNGQGGSINLVLRSKGEDNSSTWGSAGTDVEFPDRFSPQFNIGYKNSKFMVRGLMLGEYYRNQSETDVADFENGKFLQTSTSESDNRFTTELARVYFQYTPTDRDKLKFNLSHAYTYSKYVVTPSYNDELSSDKVSKGTMLRALLNYEHQFDRAKFVAEVQYNYNPQKVDYLNPGVVEQNKDDKTQGLSGKLEYAFSPLKIQERLKITVGSNFNGTFTKATIGSMRLVKGQPRNEISPDYDTYYLMPYLRFESTIGKFRLKAVGEFQHMKYDVKYGENPYNTVRNDLTGKLMAEWHFTPHKNLRLILDRNLQRPSGSQLYPFMIYNPSSLEYEKGNSELTPMLSHEIGLDYIADYRWNNDQSLLVNIGVSYNRIDDTMLKKTEGGTSSGIGLGLTQEFATYVNEGNSDLFNGNFMALYSYKAFALSFTGNICHKDTRQGTSDECLNYYNLSVYPHFNLKDGWHGGARLFYYSKMKYSSSTIGEYSCLDMTIGKSWNHFCVYLVERVMIQKRAEDVTYLANNCKQVKRYEMLPNYVGIGVKYKF